LQSLSLHSIFPKTGSLVQNEQRTHAATAWRAGASRASQRSQLEIAPGIVFGRSISLAQPRDGAAISIRGLRIRTRSLRVSKARRAKPSKPYNGFQRLGGAFLTRSRTTQTKSVYVPMSRYSTARDLKTVYTSPTPWLSPGLAVLRLGRRRSLPRVILKADLHALAGTADQLTVGVDC
jgi:hypothetical protein